MNEIFQKLNPEQQATVQAIEGPVLVLAGPGTGKTQLLSARVMEILERTDTPASSILCLTFTENGATNMQDRLHQFIGPEAYKVAISTYHGFSKSIIDNYNSYFSDRHLDKTIDEITKHQFINQLKDKMLPNNILRHARNQDILTTFSELKRGLVTVDDLRRLANQNKNDVQQFNQTINKILKDVKRFPSKFAQADQIFSQIENLLEQLIAKRAKPTDSLFYLSKQALTIAYQEARELDKSRPLTAWRSKYIIKDNDYNWQFNDGESYFWTIELANLFEAYQNLLKQNGFYDFDDMILESIDAIEKNQELRFNLQEKYLYILLDEYQDTNKAQAKLINLIADSPINEGRPNLMVVGDDDQAIYAFQGADYSNMADFYHQYRDVQVFSLTRNYRSHQDILDLATNIAQQIDDRLTNILPTPIDKQILASNPAIAEQPVVIKRLNTLTPADQNNWVADKIAELIENGADPNQIAILNPKHANLETISPFLINRQIPIRYEKKQNILKNPGVLAMIDLAKTILNLNNINANHFLIKTLSYPIWDLETATIWQLNWQTKRNQPILQTMLNSSDQKIRQIALWLMAFANLLPTLTLEACFDVIIGNTPLEINDDQQATEIFSPIKAFYLNKLPQKTVDFVLDVNILRQRFLDFSQNHSSDNHNPLQQLINMIKIHEDLEIMINRVNPYTENEQAVSLMTAFGAKGLEFKYVFLLDVNQNGWNGSGNTNKLALADNLKYIRHTKTSRDEKLRLLFVAISRAKSELYLINPVTNFNNKSNKSLEFLDEIEENNQLKSRLLPTKYQTIETLNTSADQKVLELNLFDNFSDWQDRHFKSQLKYQDLLSTQLRNFKLSPTNFNNFTDLEYGGPDQFFLNNILRFPTEFDPRLSYGTIVHATLETAQDLANHNKPIDILAIFQEKLANFELDSHTRDLFQAWGENALPKFIKQRQAIFVNSPDQIVKSEIGINNVILGEARLNGKIDRIEINKIDKIITIVDYKTGKAHLKKDKTRLNHERQLYFYKFLLESLPEYANYQIANWRLEYVSPDKTGLVHFVEGQFKAEEINFSKNLIQAVWHEIQAFAFEAPEFTKRKDFEQYLLQKWSDVKIS